MTDSGLQAFDLVIFDWAGTMVDFGCRAPIAALLEAFARHAGKMIFTSAGLPALPGTKVYQLWLLGQPRTRSAGLLPAARAGRTGPVLASGLVRGDQVGVTVEPAGGTAQPTTTPIVVMPVA